MKMLRILPSEFDKSQHPIRLGHGSLLPSEIFKRAWIVMRRKIQAEEQPIVLPIRIRRGYFDKEHDYSEAYPDRLFSRWVGNQDGYIVFDTTADGDPEVTVSCRSGEEIHDESILTTFTLEDIATVKRCGNAVSVSPTGVINTVSFGVFSVLSDMIPVWAEISTIVGIASTTLQQRVRCLIEFEADDTGEEQKQPFIIADLPEIAFMLLDACLHEPFWRPAAVESVEEEDSHEPLTDEA
jgi:hypothetical protein